MVEVGRLKFSDMINNQFLRNQFKRVEDHIETVRVDQGNKETY